MMRSLAAKREFGVGAPPSAATRICARFTHLDIATSLAVGTSTVFQTKRRFVEGNLEHALAEAVRPGGNRSSPAKSNVVGCDSKGSTA